jgi:RNA polymerase sigma factor (sigma-70 family)
MGEGHCPQQGVQLEPHALAAGSAEVVRELMADRATYLAFMRGRVRSGADAEDLLQQALMRATERASDLRDPERARAWFFQILRRTLADHHAQWAGRESKLELLAADIEEGTPEEVATCGCSLGQLDRLRPEYAELIRRVDLDDEPLAVAAAAIGITTNNATVRLHRARKALRDLLRKACGTDSIRSCLDCSCG